MGGEKKSAALISSSFCEENPHEEEAHSSSILYNRTIIQQALSYLRRSCSADDLGSTAVQISDSPVSRAGMLTCLKLLLSHALQNRNVYTLFL